MKTMPALLALAVTAGAAAPALAQPATTKTTMANPAATFCIENGGMHDIRKDDQGNEFGVCVFADGTEVDAWDFLRAHFEQTKG